MRRGSGPTLASHVRARPAERSHSCASWSADTPLPGALGRRVVLTEWNKGGWSIDVGMHHYLETETVLSARGWSKGSYDAPPVTHECMAAWRSALVLSEMSALATRPEIRPQALEQLGDLMKTFA